MVEVGLEGKVFMSDSNIRAEIIPGGFCEIVGQVGSGEGVRECWNRDKKFINVLKFSILC